MNLSRFLLILLFSIFLVIGCIKEKPEHWYGKEILVSKSPPEDTIDLLLPDTNFSWKLIKSDEGSTLSTPSPIPRKPEIIFKKNISANIGGFLATPLVEENIIFLADHLKVYALDANSGDLEWSFDVYGEYNRFVETYGIGKYLFVGTSSSEEGNSYLLAIDKENGILIWNAELEPESNASSLTSVTSNLIVADGKVCVGTVRDEGYVFCFTEDGEFLWRNKIGGNVRGLAYGNDVLFATSEPTKIIHALDIETGEKIWNYTHDNMVGTPVYRDEKIFFIDSRGDLIALSFYGEMLWRKEIYGGSDVNTNSYLAVGDKIYAPREIGERPLNLYIIDFDGNIVGSFELETDERAGAPVAAKDMVVLPAVGKNYSKIYFLRSGTDKVYEYKFESEEIYMPKISIAYGDVYAVFSWDRSKTVIIKFGDFEEPELEDIKRMRYNSVLGIKVKAGDEGSGIYRVITAYESDGTWHYIEMERVGNEYLATIPAVDHVIILIDNVGNYKIHEVTLPKHL